MLQKLQAGQVVHRSCLPQRQPLKSWRSGCLLCCNGLSCKWLVVFAIKNDLSNGTSHGRTTDCKADSAQDLQSHPFGLPLGDLCLDDVHLDRQEYGQGPEPKSPQQANHIIEEGQQGSYNCMSNTNCHNTIVVRSITGQSPHVDCQVPFHKAARCFGQ